MITRILTLEQERMLKQVSKVVGFIEVVHSKLFDEGKEQLNLRKWSKCVCKYYTDIVSINTKKVITPEDEAYMTTLNRALIYQTSEKLNVSVEEVISVFDRCREMEFPLLNIEDILAKLSPKITNRLLAIADEEQLISLVLRYYILLMNEGLFLSVDDRLYTKFTESSSLPVLVCYDSPFNGVGKYCSLFDEDGVYGAYPRYEEYIESLDVPCRLLINPPYTNLSVATCIKKTLEYMDRCSGEFIMLLPILVNFDPINRLFSYPGTCHMVLEGDRYTLYSALKDTYIIAPMSLYMVVNLRGGCVNAGRRFLNDVSYHMRVESQKLK